MIERLKVVVVVVAGLAVGTAAYADMMPASPADVAHGNASAPFVQESSRDSWQNTSFAYLRIDDLGRLPIAPLSESNADDGQVDGRQAPEVLADRQSSFGLCLYALLGLGLCRSVPLVKKFSFYQVPDWYHHAGPYQIGHSHVIGPECLSRAAVCFVQPDLVPLEEPSPQYRGEALISLWRKSQFTPTTLASRGPPIMS